MNIKCPCNKCKWAEQEQKKFYHNYKSATVTWYQSWQKQIAKAKESKFPELRDIHSRMAAKCQAEYVISLSLDLNRRP